MREIGYRGILDIGYRFDARDREYKVLDINPRVGATFRLFVGERGMDVVRAMYCHMAGLPVPPDQLQPGRKWMVEDMDTVSLFRYRVRHEITLTQWWQSLSGVQECGYWAGDDPLPLLPLFFHRSVELCRRISRRLSGKGTSKRGFGQPTSIPEKA